MGDIQQTGVESSWISFLFYDFHNPISDSSVISVATDLYDVGGVRVCQSAVVLIKLYRIRSNLSVHCQASSDWTKKERIDS